MFIYHITDGRNWYSHSVHKSLREARIFAMSLMNKDAWKDTGSITIHRIDTKRQTIDDVEIVTHGAHGAEAQKLPH